MSLAEIHEIIAGNFGLLMAGMVILMKLVDVSPIKVNPWTWLWKHLGRAVNVEVLADLNTLKDKQAKIRQSLDDHITRDDERDADMRRQRILRFNADIMDGRNFTHEYFCEMLTEIDNYERYCIEHPNYKNSRAKIAIDNIVRVCEEHERNNDFSR